MASRRIIDLDPAFQPLVRKFLSASNKLTSPWKTFITDGFRSFDEQNALYAKGRTESGKTLTNARAGFSWHNFGLAVDIAFQKDGKLSYAQSHYDKIIPISKESGFIWGGNWRIVDKPHFEWHPGISLLQARRGKRPENVIMNDDMPSWLVTMYLERGIDIRRPEGEIRNRVQEVFDGYKKYGELQKQVTELGKEVGFNAGEAAKFETELQKAVKSGEKLTKEIKDLKASVTSRDTEITKLGDQVKDLMKNIDPKTKIILPKDEYERLQKRRTTDRLSDNELYGAALKRFLKKFSIKDMLAKWDQDKKRLEAEHKKEVDKR